MRFRGSWAGLPAAVALLLSACGGRSFVIVESDGAVDDAEPPADAAPADAVTPDVKGPSDAGEDGDASMDADADAGGPRTCPIPATISNGAACTALALDCPSAQPIYTCGTGQVTGYASCMCSLDRWVCPPAMCVEAGAPPPSCPGPKLVHEAVPCATAGEECPGNPTTCSGGTEIFYDVFQCTKAMLWTRIIATVCGDGG
jgi:hypothetical protein